MNIQWMKLDVNILDNTKIQLIRKYPDGDKLFVLWIGIITNAMKSPIPGSLYISEGTPFTAEDLCIKCGLELKTVQMGLELFSRYNMIDIGEYNIITIPDFEEKQSITQIKHKRELARIRQQKKREKDKQYLLESDDCHAIVTRDIRNNNAAEKSRVEKNREDKNLYNADQEEPAFQLSNDEPVKPKKEPADSTILIDHYLSLFEANDIEKPLINHKVARKILRDMSKHYGLEKVKELLDAYFQDKWCRENVGYSLTAFQSVHTRFLTKKGKSYDTFKKSHAQHNDDAHNAKIMAQIEQEEKGGLCQ